MKRWLILAGLICVSACSTPPQFAPPSPPVVENAPPQSAPPPPVVDQCGAADLQSLIGRSRLESPVPVRPERQRVTCTTCPASQEEDPTRLNILFDAATGRITEIRCG